MENLVTMLIEESDDSTLKKIITKLSKVRYIAVLGGILVILVLAVTTVWVTNSAGRGTADAVGRVSEFYVEELANRRVQFITDEIERNYHYIGNALQVITKDDLKDKKSLRKYLGKLRKLYGIETFSFVDENGIVYNEHSTVSGLSRYPFLQGKLEKPVLSTINLYGAEKQVILALPVNNMSFMGKKLKVCFVQVNIDRMVKSMTLHTEGMETYCNVYYKNGECLTNTDFGNFESGKNFLDVMREAKLEEGKDVQKIKSDFDFGKSGHVNIQYHGIDAYVYYAPVDKSNWVLTILVYNNVISRQINSITSRILDRNRIQISITVLSLLFLFITLISLNRRNSKLLIEQEKNVAERLQKEYDHLKEEAEEAAREQLGMFEALSRDYKNVFRVDPVDRTAEVLKLTGYVTKGLSATEPEIVPYEGLKNQYIKDRVYSEDVEYMQQCMNLDNVIKKLSVKNEYESSYRVLDEGEVHFYQFKYMLLENKAIIAGFKNIDDVVQAARERETLIAMSETDLMTGLLNRGSGERKITEALKAGKGGLFILLDVDKFKSINDNYGHETGDKVIIAVGDCLKRAFRDGDIVFRLGGDEFSAYAPRVQTDRNAKKILKRFEENLAEINIPELGDRKICTSVGATIIPDGQKADFSEMYKLIDSGVYESKKVNGFCVTFK